MLEFLKDNLGTIGVLLLVVLLAGAALRSLVKDKKAGKCSCGGSCGSCSGCAHCASAGQCSAGKK